MYIDIYICKDMQYMHIQMYIYILYYNVYSLLYIYIEGPPDLVRESTEAFEASEASSFGASRFAP